MSRESVAKEVLDRAERRYIADNKKAIDFLNKYWSSLSYGTSSIDSYKQIFEAINNGANINEAISRLNKSGDIFILKIKAGVFGVITAAGNAKLSELKGEDSVEKLIGLGVDIGMAIWSVTPTGFVANTVNYAASMAGYDLSQFFKDAYGKISGNGFDDVIITDNGFIRATMSDGTVYSRPASDELIKLFHLAISKGGSLFGDGKDDVLFGSNGNDILNGHAGSDILIGGAGKDDYFVDNGDTIKDSDGKGRVFLSSTNIQLTGGTQTKKGSKIYKGKDGTTYKLKGSDLIINDNITIENFSKISNDLGIVLVDVDDIVVTIGNNQSTEGGNGKHSMEFKITLNRALKKDEFLELIINGQRIKFKEGDIEQTYTHTWDGNTIKEEDRKFEVSGIVMQTSENLNVQAIISGQGLIKDDDQDNDPDPELEASPIVIDLGNDGINSHALNYTINFDLDNNGFKEATGWVSGDDALLAIDKNNNGMIDNGSELFGNESISDSAFSYTNSSLNNGFETLKSYDTNNDDIIDSQDAEFDKLLLWQDKNGNGISETDELIKLSDKAEFANLNLLVA